MSLQYSKMRATLVHSVPCFLVMAGLLCLPATQSRAQGCDDTPDHFVFAANTGDNYAIVVDSTSLDCSLSGCDEIGVFDGELCVGASVFRGQWPLAITAWKDDTQTGVMDGYAAGNSMTFKVWHSSEDSEPPIVEATYSAGNGNFDSGPFARLWLGCPCPDLIGPDPGTLKPPDGSSGSIDVTFYWEQVYLATEYEIRIDTAQSGEPYTWLRDSISDTSYAVSLPSISNPEIYWMVRPLGYGTCPNGSWTSPAIYSDVEGFDQGSLPSQYILAQNYPNPFNPTTTIEFDLPRRSVVNIDIFNLLGQKVLTLVDQDCSAGSYRVDWDGSTDLGRTASTGVYLYRIKAEGFIETKKMILMK